MTQHDTGNDWPERPGVSPDLMTPHEAAMFLRLDQTGHTPAGAYGNLNYWRNGGELKATKCARRIWYLREELEVFLESRMRTEQQNLPQGRTAPLPTITLEDFVAEHAHDLRRSCLTNWACELPAHVVQKPAGHSDIKTTQKYYLIVRQEDMEKARKVTARILGDDQTHPAPKPGPAATNLINRKVDGDAK